MMLERVEVVGAHLLVTSQPGQGTKLSLRWAEAVKKEIL
jgi:signal transduction histidine kinase